MMPISLMTIWPIILQDPKLYALNLPNFCPTYIKPRMAKEKHESEKISSTRIWGRVSAHTPLGLGTPIVYINFDTFWLY